MITRVKDHVACTKKTDGIKKIYSHPNVRRKKKTDRPVGKKNTLSVFFFNRRPFFVDSH